MKLCKLEYIDEDGNYCALGAVFKKHGATDDELKSLGDAKVGGAFFRFLTADWYKKTLEGYSVYDLRTMQEINDNIRNASGSDLIALRSFLFENEIIQTMDEEIEVV